MASVLELFGIGKPKAKVATDTKVQDTVKANSASHERLQRAMRELGAVGDLADTLAPNGGAHGKVAKSS